MNIIETDIFDFNQQIENIDKYKLNNINNIINELKPFILSSDNNISNVSLLNKKKKEILKDKEILESLINELNKKKKIKQLLENINKKIKNKKFINKHEINVLLKVIETLSIEKLDYYIKKLNP